MKLKIKTLKIIVNLIKKIKYHLTINYKTLLITIYLTITVNKRIKYIYKLIKI